MQELGARVGELHAVAGPLEQLDPERSFQLGDRLRQARLGDEQPGGRAPEMPFLGDADEVAQLPELHLGIVITGFRAGQQTDDWVAPDQIGRTGSHGQPPGSWPGHRTSTGLSTPSRRRIPRSRPVPLGLLLAPIESRALGDRQARVAGKVAVPLGAQAAHVGRAPPRLVELRVPAGSAEPGLCAELAPRGIRRPVRHGTQDMRPRRPP